MSATEDITIDSITKIEGNAKLKLHVVDGIVESLQFIIADYRRFYTEAVIGKRYASVPAVLSRICGTCSAAHLLASIEAVEKAIGINDQITPQTRILRQLCVNGMMIRDHALHLYLFCLPDLLGVDSVFDIKDEDLKATQLLHDAFDLKALGNKLSTTVAGAAVHAPFPVVGGFLKIPDNAVKQPFIEELEKAREKAIRGIEVFAAWKEELHGNTDFVALISKDFSFTQGEIKVNNEISFKEEDFITLFQDVIVPYSESKSYTIKSTNEDYLCGALARLNLNKDALHENTKRDAKKHLERFPSTNIFDNCLAQAIEILHCIDNSIDILKSTEFVPEKPIAAEPHAGKGVGIVEAPRGILYHMIEVNLEGLITNCDVIVPTSQNQLNIENSLKKFFTDHMTVMSKEQIKFEAEKIIRAYDPCMSCTTNFLEIEWTED